MSTHRLVILAAGLSSRFGRLKQLEPIGPSGETLIDYSLHNAMKAGFSKIDFFVSKKNMKEITSRYEKIYKDKFELRFIEQKIEDTPPEYSITSTRIKPWGTGHVFYSLRNYIKEQFCFINGDDYYGPIAFEIISNHLAKITGASSYFCMVGYKLKDCIHKTGEFSRAICEVKNDTLVSIKEYQHVRYEGDQIVGEFEDEEEVLNENSIVSMNMWAATPRMFLQAEKAFQEFLMDNIFDEGSEFGFPVVINNMLKKHLVTVQVGSSEEPWFGLTTVKDLKTTKEKIMDLHQQGYYPDKLF